MSLPLRFAPDVSSALSEGQPVVALESTIITHGMPWPQNVETARQVEAEVRAFGAVPATIAVLEGQIHVGLRDDDLVALAQTKDVAKLSRADIAACVATGGTGATTVAATMIVAHLSGIKVFATGGIGGVHRGAELSFDVSADLYELSKTPVIVVAAGAKAILDIPKTLELLETLGVPVIAFGQTYFPAFWSRSAGLVAPLSMDDPADIARAMQIREKLGLEGGQLVANPIPAEAEIPREKIIPIIEDALRVAENEGVAAKDVTPFLLEQVYYATKGLSLTANIALIKNNARLAARIARELIT